MTSPKGSEKHQEKLNWTVKQLEKDVAKKCELEMILATDLKIDPVEVFDTEFKEKNTGEHIGSKKEQSGMS